MGVIMFLSANDINNKIYDIINFINSKVSIKLDLGMILGSGLGDLVNQVTDKIIIPYEQIPHLPSSTAPGHSGNLIFGKFNNKNIMVMQGRLHVYEGHDPKDATLLVRVMKLLGINNVIITCAAGGLNNTFMAGDIMLITDHINFSGTNPLVGENLNNLGPRFVGMFDIYTKRLQQLAYETALELKISLKNGIYAAILGPTYATRAELQFYINHNCDAIGMSVVHEAIVSAHCGMNILGLAAITDMALPYADHHATGEEVIESGKKIQANMIRLLNNIVPHI
jgi:purine-nucleoside phosphorylase